MAHIKKKKILKKRTKYYSHLSHIVIEAIMFLYSLFLQTCVLIFIIYLFGCTASQLQHTGSSLQQADL